ncbi:DUF1254 domain-containing protein [Streptosporangium amethystogenes]|uniref:DUF1254 domain-containing protein n=1 Tax=Streptosporangium amethystogenes TaxID=2002 RepID=UPI0004C48BB7|nr:DUF1254 domain-containing protein [Streptosporangium amethystogenes]
MPLPDDQVLAIATDAYVFGYPLVLMDITKAIDTNIDPDHKDEHAPINQFVHVRDLPAPEDRTVVRTNQDTLYSFAWLDLTTEPIVLSLPDMQAKERDDDTERPRYWLMQIMDAWSNTLHNPGQTITDTPAAFLLSGPGWNGDAPADTTPLSMPTNTVWIVGRTELKALGDEAELDNVHALQDDMRLIPLSAWSSPGTYVPPPGTFDPDIDLETPPPAQVTAMDAVTFYNRLCALMVTNPASPEDPDMMERLASIGIAPGGTVGDLNSDLLEQAKKDGEARVNAYTNPADVNLNGWLSSPNLGSYGTDYDLRASTALRGLGANLPEDSLYPSTASPATDTRFRLHFEPGGLPPVGAFWSITAYDTDGYFIPNDAEKYAVGHQEAITLNPDDSADIFIQPDNPGSDIPASNWLPVGTDPFTLTMRLYAPDLDAIDAGWKPPPLTPER